MVNALKSNSDARPSQKVLKTQLHVLFSHSSRNQVAMEKVMTQLASAKITQTAEFPAKKPAASRGKAIVLQTNLTKIGLKPNIPYYKYDVAIFGYFNKGDGQERGVKELTKPSKDDATVHQKRSACVTLFKAALESSNTCFDDTTTFYNRAKILFSLKKLPIGEEIKIIPIKMKVKGYEIDNWEFKIKTCKESFQTSTNDLKKVVNCCVSDQDKSLLEALNIICGKECFMNDIEYVTYGHGTHYLLHPENYGFKQSDLPSLPDGKEMMIAVSKKVSVLSGPDVKNPVPTAYITTEIKKSSVHKIQPLFEKIRELLGKSITADAISRNIKQLTEVMKGLMVYTTYRKSRFSISGIATETAITMVIDPTKKLTVQQYFLQTYGIKLAHPELNLITAYVRGHMCSFPIELLMVEPHQRVTNSQTSPAEMQISIRASATLPLNRLQQTNEMKHSLHLEPSNKALISAGLIVDKNMAQVQARVLPTPVIIYANNKSVYVKNSSKWDDQSEKYAICAKIPNWFFVRNFSGKEQMQQRTLDEFKERLLIMCASKGIEIGKGVNLDCRKGLEGIFIRALNENATFIFVVSSDSLKDHDELKALENTYQIVTQEIRSSTVEKVIFRNQSQTLSNIIAKINGKNGGMCYTINPINLQKEMAFFDPKILYIGLEMTHPTKLTDSEVKRGIKYKIPSILGYASNCCSNPQYFVGDYRFVDPRRIESMGLELEFILPYLLKETKSSRATPPTRLVFFFHGVAEGSYSEVATIYLNKIKDACATLSPQYKPGIICIVVNKLHSERFYPQPIKGIRANEQNVEPGTIVDSVVVNPKINEFYLTSHSAPQGTAKAPKYTVLVDTVGASLDWIQGATHSLCFLHQIVNMTVSLPSPLCVADRSAKRGMKNFMANAGNSSGGDLNLKELNEKFTNFQKNNSKVRYNS